MFVVTLSKASVKKLGVGAMCCALVVFSAMLGRYISTRSVAVAAAGNKIESAQDIQTWFTGYGLDVDGASITADKVKIPRKWDDSFSAFNGVVQALPFLEGIVGSYVKYPEDDDIDHLIIGFAQDNGTDTWRSEDLQFWTNSWSYRDFDHGVTLPLMMKNGHEIGQKMAHALWEQAAE